MTAPSSRKRQVKLEEEEAGACPKGKRQAFHASGEMGIVDAPCQYVKSTTLNSTLEPGEDR